VRRLIPVLLLFVWPSGVRLSAAPPHVDPWTVHVFHAQGIHFLPDEPDARVSGPVRAEDNGRVILRTVDLPEPPVPVRILARVRFLPVAKDEAEVHDKWDRAAGVRLVVPGRPDLEVVKLVTAYGGVTDHEVDVTHLAPLLTGSRTFLGFVDTWTSPAWTLDFSLTFLPDTTARPPDWVEPILFDTFTEENRREGPHTVQVEVPAGTRRTVLQYLVSGHCTDGRDADEFESKENVISVDGVEVKRFRPWRDDCRRFREDNPYCRRWTDGSWSSDYARSGWCPSDMVSPVEVDLTGPLAPGEHEISFHILGIRPEDEEGNHGYWRVSARLLGWSAPE
jgi:hypothetical protein